MHATHTSGYCIYIVEASYVEALSTRLLLSLMQSLHIMCHQPHHHHHQCSLTKCGYNIIANYLLGSAAWRYCAVEVG